MLCSILRYGYGWFCQAVTRSKSCSCSSSYIAQQVELTLVAAWTPQGQHCTLPQNGPQALLPPVGTFHGPYQATPVTVPPGSVQLGSSHAQGQIEVRPEGLLNVAESHLKPGKCLHLRRRQHGLGLLRTPSNNIYSGAGRCFPMGGLLQCGWKTYMWNLIFICEKIIL